MFTLIPLLLGFALDAIIGDPQRMPHPVRLFGWLISNGEKQLNRGKHRKPKGAIMAVLFIALVAMMVYLLLWATESVPVAHLALETLGVFFCLANRNLLDECSRVMRRLQTEGLEAGRKQLSFIVGRDTSQLSEQKIRTAVLETLSENLSDGVIAPLFWYMLGGLPAMFAYKMVNTLDSMIGYKSERYKQFGCIAARIDDVANFIPARLTALLMSIAALSKRGLQFAARYGHRHASPNSGYPEATLAGILDCQFGGPNVYHGVMVQKPFIGENSRTLTDKDFSKAKKTNILSSVLMLALSAVLIWFVF